MAALPLFDLGKGELVACVAIVLDLLGAGCSAAAQEQTPASGLSAATSKAPGQRELLPADMMEKLRTDPDGKFYVLGLQLSLKELGYMRRPFTGEADERTLDALAEYRTDVGLSVGRYLVDEALSKRMAEDLAALREPPGLGTYFFSDLGSTVSARGTWKIVGHGTGNPYQRSEIICIRAAMLCFDATATAPDGGEIISAAAWIREVDRWTEQEIVTKPTHAECASTVMRVNRVTKRFSMTRTTTKTSGLCEGMEAEDVLVTLVDGWEEVSRDASRRHRDALWRILDLPGKPRRN